VAEPPADRTPPVSVPAQPVPADVAGAGPVPADVATAAPVSAEVTRTDALPFAYPAPFAVPAPVAPERRSRAAVIVLSVLNTLLLLTIGGLVALLLQFQQRWDSDQAQRDQQISEVGAQIAGVEADISDRTAEEADFKAKEAEATKREAGVAECVAAVRALVARLDAGEKDVPLSYDDPCGVPVSGRWTFNNE
jgi:hypothetical protein